MFPSACACQVYNLRHVGQLLLALLVRAPPAPDDTTTGEMLHYGLPGFVRHKITQQRLCKENFNCVLASVLIKLCPSCLSSV